jgi:hypothetical protein
MDIVVALIGLALVIVVAVYVAAPLTARSRRTTAPEELPRDKLLAERNTVLVAMRDLDFDFQTGKLLEEDYRAMRDKYAARGVEILKELDAMPDGGQKPEVRRSKGERSAGVDEIEAAVQARRRGRPQVSRTAEEDDIEAAVRARRNMPRPNLQSPISLKCPSCGRAIDSTDKFCARCGAALSVEATR